MGERTLHLVPIIHAEADLGKLSDQIRRVAIEQLGADVWERKAGAVEAVWDRIEAWCESLGHDLNGLRVYQDGLPVTDHAIKIVRELAQKGSRNHAIVERLMGRGAELVGTESPELLLREYEAVRAALESGDTEALTAPPGATGTLAARDEFIARRISETLPADGEGVLFIGMLHDVASRLPGDVAVRRPLSDNPVHIDSGAQR